MTSNLIYNSNRKFEVVDLKWDTSFFGVPAAKVLLLDTLSNENWETLNRSIDEFSFITFISDYGKNISGIHNNTTAYLVDIAMRLKKDVSSNSGLSNQSSEVSISNYFKGSDEIISLSKKSFEKSRFYSDHNIGFDKASLLYESWIRSSLNMKDKYFITHNPSSSFLLFSVDEKSTSIEIELLSIEEPWRGKGVATQLIAQLDFFCRLNSITSVWVSTQAANIPALNLYVKNQFAFVSTKYVFHEWRK